MSHADDTIHQTRQTPSSDGQNGASTDAAHVTRSLNHSSTGSGHLEVRCPNCHAPSEIAVDTRLTDLTCSACGSHFSLVDQGQETRMAPSLTQMGRFELIERIGVGGFGSVWKARDKELDRTVAIKIPRQGGMTAEEQEKFFREARAAAQLRHPGIVSVHEVGRDGQSVYIVSDFVRGVTLGDWLTGQKLTSREAAELTAKIAGALHHAHEQGVVHRDLKPANVMMDIDNEPHLMDFGLARREVGEVTVTMDGQVLGTPAYMSPEQALGEGHTADRRSDVYSLGVILFQLLTGELPFRGNARMLVHQVIRDEPPSPRKLNGNVPRDLETITLKCLEKDPANRYQSADELVMELRRFLAKEPIYARPISRIERGWRWCKRNPTVAALSAILLLGLISISTIAPAIAARQASLRRTAQRAEAAARVEAKRAAREAATSKRLADFVGAKYALTQGRLREAYQQITAAIQSQPSWEYGRILGDIVDQSRRDWQLLTSIPCKQRPDWGCFVGRGPNWVVFATGGEMVVHSLVRKDPVATIPLEAKSGLPCAVGGDRLALSTGFDTITIYSIPDLRVVATCAFPGSLKEIRSNAKGEYFVALNDQGLVRVFNREGGQLAERKFKPGMAELPLRPMVDLSPSNRFVLYDSGLYSDYKVRWDWQADKITEFELQAHNSRLRDDNTAWGMWSGSDSSTAWLMSADIKTEISRTLFQSDNYILSTGMSGGLEGIGAGEGLGGVAVISQHGINLLESNDQQPEFWRDVEQQVDQVGYRLSSVRYESIWPHSKNAPQLLAYEPATRTLALTADGGIYLFTDWMQHTLGSSLDVNAAFWSLDVAGQNAMIVLGDSLQVVDLRTLSIRQHSLSSPEPDEDYTFVPWGVAFTPDSRFAAILWQESDDEGSMASRYFRKVIRVYELPQGGVTDPPRVVGEVLLGDYFGAPGRTNRELWISHDATIVALCNSQGLAAAYHVADGQQIYKMRVPAPATFARSCDPPLLGRPDTNADGEFRVWNPLTGALVAQIPVDEMVLRGAFSRDGTTVYLGMASKQLRQYRLADAALLSKVDTPVVPIAISPAGDRYIGFIPDTRSSGRTVLANLTDGRTLEEIDPTAHILNDAYFSADGRTFAFTLTRDQIRILRSLDIPQALHWLQYAAIEPELAIASENFLDYRERMAARNIAQGDAAAGKNRRALAIDAYRAAEDIIQGLMADFPDNVDYVAMLALNFERLAALEAEAASREDLQERAHSLRVKLARVAPELNLQSSDADSLNELAWEAATSADEKLRNGPQAVKLATRACELTEFKVAAYVDTLAAAYAEAGDFDAAVKWSQDAIKLLDEDSDDEFKSHVTQALALYQAKKPFREPTPDEAEGSESPAPTNDEVSPPLPAAPPLPPGADEPGSQPSTDTTSPTAT